ncbi:MAG: glycerate kinase [Spirochaetaceae bacterium]|nr:MAG: glycerate kinase [Spirochaetaceae bacterium]
MNQEAARKIAEAALKRVDPVRMITDCLSLTADTLNIKTETQELSFDLSTFERIVVLGAGKAGASMALGVEQVLGDRIDQGLIVVKYEHVRELERIEIAEAGHPVPDQNGVAATGRLVELAESADEKTLCLMLISGGGSALLTLPMKTDDIEVTLEDTQRTTELLLEAGTPIQDINCIRKHISAVTGGRFCRSLHPATVVSLILSDVVGDELESIASGVTSPDPTSFDDAWEIAEKYKIADKLPDRVRTVLEDGRSGRIPETPKPGDDIFDRVHNVLIGTNALALEAARRAAEELGFNTLVLTSQLTGEAREIAKVFSGVAKDLVRLGSPVARPACFLAGGETTVTLHGAGKGGRNQEMALAFLAEVAARPNAYRGVTFLSAATDGTDGPTDAAGAFASVEVVEASVAAGLSIRRYLAENDSYHFFGKIDGLYKTGPTNTNVCDLQIVLVE